MVKYLCLWVLLSSTVKVSYYQIRNLRFEPCGAKGSGDSGPFDIKPKVHVEEEEVPEDE